MRRSRMVTMPFWLTQATIVLGCFWLAIGWAFNAGLWVLGIAIALLVGLIAKHRYDQVTLQPWSKERGTVVWAHRRKTDLSAPRLVWDEASSPLPTEATQAVVEAPPPEATPASIAANERSQSRPLPFPPPAPESPSAAVPTAAAAPAATDGPTDTGRKICPDCAETVLSEARVCRHCGYRFEPADAHEPTSP